MSEGDAEKDYYEMLGASDDAPREEIGRRYKRLAAEHHPDRGGSEEQMKELNEAYRVLGDNATREAYDVRRRVRAEQGPSDDLSDEKLEGVIVAEDWFAHDGFTPASSRAARADAVWGRVVGALLMIFLGLVLLLLVRTHYVVFLFPLALLAAALVFFGVWMAHAAMVYAREGLEASHFARRFVWAQEIVFWSSVAGGLCGVYMLCTAF
ncbi:MAG: molecular chaperone DnaJ [Acidobacteriota bacterium]|nr:molecular chaperone DnaJ [Acidobacteriota bacterium]